MPAKVAPMDQESQETESPSKTLNQSRSSESNLNLQTDVNNEETEKYMEYIENRDKQKKEQQEGARCCACLPLSLGIKIMRVLVYLALLEGFTELYYAIIKSQLVSKDDKSSGSFLDNLFSIIWLVYIIPNISAAYLFTKHM